MALTEKKRRVADLTGRGYSRAETAKRVGVSERTVYDYLSDPDVRAEAQRVQEEAGDPSALDVLRDLLSDPDPHIRLSAAVALLKAPHGTGQGDPTKETHTVTFHVTAPEPSPDAGEAPNPEAPSPPPLSAVAD